MLDLLHTYTPTLLLIGLLAIALHLAGSGQAPLIVDAAFVALLLARPSLPAAALLVVQYGARRWAVSSRGLASFVAMPEIVTGVLLPGAGRAPVSRAATEPTIVLPAPAARPLPPREWLHRLNHDATAPHLAVVGPTRAGKTTLVQAALGNRPGQVVIATPKPVSKDPWGGAGAVRLGEERGDVTYAPLADAVDQVYREMLRRNREDAAAEQLTLVLDDYSTLVAERPEVRPQVLRLWTMAASAGVRVVIIDTEESVKAWGIEGRGDARSNLIFVRVNPDRSAEIYRWGETHAPIDTAQVKQLADHAQLAGRVWPGLSVWSSVRPSVAVETANMPPATQTDGRTAEHQAKIALLTELRSRMSRDAARAYLVPRGITFENKDWTEAGEPSAPSAAS